MRQIRAVLMHWFPERAFVCVPATAATAPTSWLALPIDIGADANLYAPPPAPRSKRKGQPRRRGRKLASPAQVVKRSPRTRMSVLRYGGEMRRVEVVLGTAHWYKNGGGLVPIRWLVRHIRYSNE